MLVLMTLRIHCPLQLCLLLSVFTFVAAIDDCDSSTTAINDYNVHTRNPFFYCCKRNTSEWVGSQSYLDQNVCSRVGRQARIALKNILIFPEKEDSPDKERCHNFNALYYSKQKNGSCESSLVKPFLERFSGRTWPSADDVKSLTLNHVTPLRVSYQFECVTEETKIDMCRHNSSYFDTKSKVQLSFSPDSLGKATRCQCRVTSSNPSTPITARALDIRLNAQNSLLFDSQKLNQHKVYWWNNGVLSTAFSSIRLLDVDHRHLPTQVWIEVYGNNLTVSCDAGSVDDSNGPSSPSSGGFDKIIFVYIGIGVLGLLILMCVMKRCMSRSGKKKDEDDEIEEYVMTRSNVERSSTVPEEDTLITTESEVDASKPLKPAGENAGKTKEMYDTSRQNGKTFNEDVEIHLTNNNQNLDESISLEDISLKDIVQSDNTKHHIYSHLGDKPDIVLHSPSNIYDTTGEDEYSVLRKHEPYVTTTDNNYDVA